MPTGSLRTLLAMGALVTLDAVPTIASSPRSKQRSLYGVKTQPRRVNGNPLAWGWATSPLRMYDVLNAWKRHALLGLRSTERPWRLIHKAAAANQRNTLSLLDRAASHPVERDRRDQLLTTPLWDEVRRCYEHPYPWEEDDPDSIKNNRIFSEANRGKAGFSFYYFVRDQMGLSALDLTILHGHLESAQELANRGGTRWLLSPYETMRRSFLGEHLRFSVGRVATPLHYSVMRSTKEHQRLFDWLHTIVQSNAKRPAKPKRRRPIQESPYDYIAVEAQNKPSIFYRFDTVDLPDSDGMTPLHYSVAFGNKWAVERLLDLRADTNAASYSHGTTPLMLAAAAQNGTATRLLIQHGAKRGLNDKLGHTALHYASKTMSPYKATGFPAAKQAFLESVLLKRLINQQNVSGETALHFAAETGNFGLARFLVQQGAKNLKNASNRRPSDIARSTGRRNEGLAQFLEFNAKD